ncbi:MAG: MATE family efflux transporter [Lachnospiraceae bacterium]|nr:MATE family efflux transporter [Lachnospiraceae bacterium]
MAKDVTQKLTSGKPMSLIIGFSLPLLVGMLFQQFYSLVDTIIVGKCLGVEALAAVGSTGAINFLIIGFCMGVCSGFAIPVAQRFGAEDYEGLRKYVANSLWLCCILSAIMTVVVGVFCRQILILMQTPSNIIDQAYAYIFIIFLGIPVTYLYNMTSGIMRSLGDSKTPVYFLLLASGLNILLDLIFMAVLGMGVEGAGYATVISQFVSGIGCLIFMKKRFTILRITREDWRWSNHYASTLCRMGIPMGLQYSITAIGSVILQTSVNRLGSDAVAAITAANRINVFMACPFDALGSTMATYGGQNVGAMKLQRVKDGLKSATFLGFCYSVLAVGILYFFSRFLLLLFLSPSEVEIIGNARTFLLTQAYFFFPLAIVNIFRFMIQGMGFSSFAVLAGVMEMIARTVIALTLVPAVGFMGACFASPFAWILADLFLVPAFFYVHKKLQKKFQSGCCL